MLCSSASVIGLKEKTLQYHCYIEGNSIRLTKSYKTEENQQSNCSVHLDFEGDQKYHYWKSDAHQDRINSSKSAVTNWRSTRKREKNTSLYRSPSLSDCAETYNDSNQTDHENAETYVVSDFLIR